MEPKKTNLLHKGEREQGQKPEIHREPARKDPEPKYYFRIFLRALLSVFLDFFRRDAHGRSPAEGALCMAALNNDIKEVVVRIRQGVDVNVKSPENITPLMMAAQKGHGEIVRLLIEEGADVHMAAELTGLTALMMAAKHGRIEIVQELLQAGAEVGARGLFNTTALIEAAKERHTKVIEILLDHGAEIDGVTTTGMTPLMYAAKNDDMESAKYLLERGARADLLSQSGKSALTWAKERKSRSIELLLNKAGTPD